MHDTFQALLAELGITRFGEVAVADIVFNPAFREACAMNQCGQYGANWVCPPAVGGSAELIAHAKTFTRGLVIQTVWPLEDAFDFDGMMAGKDKHTELFRQAVERILGAQASRLQSRSQAAGRRDACAPSTLALNAGACTLCESCTYPEGKPCRQPGQAMASLEAYCIDVAALIHSAGLSYTNGPDTVSYVGLLLFGE